jgi:starch phosphorylase
MRLLVDEHGSTGTRPGTITRADVRYTNHTLLPEALETWPVPLFGALLPRHLEIIYEINRRFLDEVRARYPGDEARLARMSLIDEDGASRCAWRTWRSSAASINGVAALHSELLKQTVLRDFARDVARAVQQQDQRRHAAALAGCWQPPAAALITARSATAG